MNKNISKNTIITTSIVVAAVVVATSIFCATILPKKIDNISNSQTATSRKTCTIIISSTHKWVHIDKTQVENILKENPKIDKIVINSKKSSLIIESNTFENLKIRELEINANENSVYMGTAAVNNCKNLTHVNIKATNPCAINKSSFKNCKNLYFIMINDLNLENSTRYNNSSYEVNFHKNVCFIQFHDFTTDFNKNFLSEIVKNHHQIKHIVISTKSYLVIPEQIASEELSDIRTIDIFSNNQTELSLNAFANLEHLESINCICTNQKERQDLGIDETVKKINAYGNFNVYAATQNNVECYDGAEFKKFE